MTLYEIDQSLLELMESVDPETGEWTGDPEAWERLTLEREVKIENTACYIKDLRGKIADFKAEIDALRKRQKTLENKEEWLMGRLRDSLNGANFETTRCALKWKKNPVKVKYDEDVDTLNWALKHAPDCVRMGDPSLVTGAVKQHLLDGDVIPGAELVRETRLEVK